MTRTDTAARGELLCVLANPPAGSGERTLARLEQARALLGFETVRVGNLFAFPSADVTDITELGATPGAWMEARKQLAPAVASCDGVLLAYGLSEPTGPARHHREQVRWLTERLVEAECRAFQLGDGPRHPSRWQRWTARHYGGLTFAAALQASLTKTELAHPGVVV